MFSFCFAALRLSTTSSFAALISPLRDPLMTLSNQEEQKLRAQSIRELLPLLTIFTNQEEQKLSAQPIRVLLTISTNQKQPEPTAQSIRKQRCQLVPQPVRHQG
jgi:hypothetical protein